MKKSPIYRTLLCLLATICLTAALSACAGEILHQETVDGLTYTLHGTSERVEQITVTRDGKRIGAYQKRGLQGIGQVEHCGFRLIDLNFDGNADMQLLIARGDIGDVYATYLWNESDEKYVYHSTLSTMQDVGAIIALGAVTAREYKVEIDPATDDTPEFEIITESFVIYRWQGNNLTPIHRKDLTYYEESDIYCYFITEVNEGGEWETVRESWITAERFDPEKCPLNANGFEGYANP